MAIFSVGNLVYLADKGKVYRIESYVNSKVTLKNGEERVRVSIKELKELPEQYILEIWEDYKYKDDIPFYVSDSYSKPVGAQIYNKKREEYEFWEEEKLKEYFLSYKPMTKNLVKKLIARARKELKKKARPTSVASYAVISDKEIALNSNDICHARMNAAKNIHAVVDIHNKWKECIDKKYHKAYKEVVSYIIRDSVWKDAFLCNNPQTFLAHGVVINTQLPSSYVFQAVVALRMPKERRDRLPVWKALRKANISPEVAYLLMLSFITSVNTYTLSICNSHSPISSHCSVKKLLSLLKGDKSAFENEKPLFTGHNWRVHEKFETEGENDALHSTISSMIEEEKKDSKNVTSKTVWGATTYYLNKNGLIAIGKKFDKMMEEV